MLPIAGLTLISLLVTAGLAVAGWGRPVAVLHMAFAVGIVPLILAAMTHFLPVLTRSAEPPGVVRSLPYVAQATGLLVVAGMAGWLPAGSLALAATVDGLLAAILLGWMVRRARHALGAPHPGWRWYAAALGLFILAMLAVVAMTLLPADWLLWRHLHLHLTTLGLVGMAALGTLPVLLPTALGQPDPQAAAWLRRFLVPTGLAVLLLAAGLVFAPAVAGLAGALLSGIMLALGIGWCRRFGLTSLLRDGAACALAAAVLGGALCLLAGIAHGLGLLPGRPTLWAWGAAFLLPLVTGALSQLLPVWARPGPMSPERQRWRAVLTAGGQGRSLLFLAAGGLFLGAWPAPATILAASGLLWFIAGLLRARQLGT